MWSNITNAVVAAGIAALLILNDVPLETSLLVGFIAGYFYALGDISYTLRSQK